MLQERILTPVQMATTVQQEQTNPFPVPQESIVQALDLILHLETVLLDITACKAQILLLLLVELLEILVQLELTASLALQFILNAILELLMLTLEELSQQIVKLVLQEQDV